ncbi:hypothetical protein N0B30_23755 [Bacillus subtilis]|uniref:hypothetical protein n=1 Tax=Bacillus TaxID=1386 RepID=UPI00080CA321|nr:MULTISPECIES: hypothetical protein [Bacillus subtilis group]MCT6515640.1 hypothetical protein [Bacillus subtilis]OCB98138.1 hypothetical protein SRCM101294_00792 [Bacillus amyloliquefaciens]QEO08541.1 hypothetical protein FLQ07_23490 [Bacillus paralicheniformis]HEO2443873.1 hypothetical protein [Streptococcus agalactiae]
MSEKKYKVFQPKDKIQLRLPVDTSPDVIKYINRLSRRYGRNFSKEMVHRLISVLETELQINKTKRNSIIVPLPEKLTYHESKKLESEEVRSLIGQLALQLIREPAKAVRLSSEEDEVSKAGDNKSPETAPVIQNEKVLQFAQDNFLDFDDDDD